MTIYERSTGLRWRGVLVSLACAALAFLPAHAQSQNYPAKPINFIFLSPPGSAADTAWRAMVEEAGQAIGGRFIYENRPGAGGKIALRAITSAAPDGYTVGVINSLVGVAAAVQEDAYFARPGKDYTPIVNAMETYTVVVARANAPFRDAKSLVAYAKANPGKVTVATSGPSVVFQLMKRAMDIDITDVLYNGEAPGTTAALGGHVDLIISAASLKPHVDSGALIAIGSTGPKRWSVFPNVATMVEQGFPSFSDSVWLGAIGPQGMPRPIVERLNRAFNEALTRPAVKESFAKLGLSVVGGSPEDFTAAINRDIERKGPIVKAISPN